MINDVYIKDAICLLEELISTPSVSRNESEVADIMMRHVEKYGLIPKREANNVWILDPNFNTSRPTLLLNAHLDTVKPVESWTRKPYSPIIEGDFLYGLGSNDCGGGLVTLLQVFRALLPIDRSFNMIFLASAEEEVSGIDGIRRAIPLLPDIDVAIIGEPTNMQPAIAEKGLMVLDITAHGKSGHAARGEGINAIYMALSDLNWLHNYQFKKVSPLLGPTLMNVTIINAGTQHNVIPDECHMVVDIRTNEYYNNKDVYDFICQHVKSEVKARSFHLHSSHISLEHPLVKKCLEMGMKPFGSPTLSDQALMNFPSLKLGPGMSSRSHSADEFIRISEIKSAFSSYLKLLTGLDLTC